MATERHRWLSRQAHIVVPPLGNQPGTKNMTTIQLLSSDEEEIEELAVEQSSTQSQSDTAIVQNCDSIQESHVYPSTLAPPESRDHAAHMHADMMRLAESLPPHLKEATLEVAELLLGKLVRKSSHGQYVEVGVDGEQTTSGGLRNWTRSTTKVAYKQAIEHLSNAYGRDYNADCEALSGAGVDRYADVSLGPSPLNGISYTKEDFKNIETDVLVVSTPLNKDWQFACASMPRLSTALRKGYILAFWVQEIITELSQLRGTLDPSFDLYAG